GFQWQGCYYHYNVLPFRLSSVPWTMKLIRPVRAAVLRRTGIKNCSYKDDFLSGQPGQMPASPSKDAADAEEVRMVCAEGEVNAYPCNHSDIPRHVHFHVPLVMIKAPGEKIKNACHLANKLYKAAPIICRRLI